MKTPAMVVAGGPKDSVVGRNFDCIKPATPLPIPLPIPPPGVSGVR
jgi:hypothetical protein